MQLIIHHYPQVLSTNKTAREYLALGAPEGTVIMADEQTAGQGQFGRVWHSPPGNLYCSILLTPSADMVPFYHQLGYVVAVALQKALHEILPTLPITLKYPNDILIEGKKIAGILIEVEEKTMIVGLGLNVHHAPLGLDQPTTSLQEYAGQPLAVTDISQVVLRHLWHTYQDWLNQKFPTIHQAWVQHSLPKQTTN